MNIGNGDDDGDSDCDGDSYGLLWMLLLMFYWGISEMMGKNGP